MHLSIDALQMFMRRGASRILDFTSTLRSYLSLTLAPEVQGGLSGSSQVPKP